MVGLALFDSRVFAEMKRLTLAAMEDPAPDHPPQRPKVKSDAFEHLGLESFWAIKTKRLFSIVGLPQTFRAIDYSLNAMRTHSRGLAHHQRDRSR